MGVESHTFAYDAAGNQTLAAAPGGTYTLAYDARNQVAAVNQPFGVTQTFTYDGTGNRTAVADSFGVRVRRLDVLWGVAGWWLSQPRRPAVSDPDPVPVPTSVPTAPADREQFWRDAVAAFNSSGLSVREFCRRSRLHERRLYIWRKVLDLSPVAARAATTRRPPRRCRGSCPSGWWPTPSPR